MPHTPTPRSSHIANRAGFVRHVFIRNLELPAEIGIHDREKGRHQIVRINVDLAVEDSPPVEDKLEEVVDYAPIAERIREILQGGHVHLAETMAERIASICFEDKRVKSARVRVEKLRFLPGSESVGVEIEREAPQSADNTAQLLVDEVKGS